MHETIPPRRCPPLTYEDATVGRRGTADHHHTPRLAPTVPALGRYGRPAPASYFLADPGSAILRCISALTLSGMKRLPRPWSFVLSDAETTRSSPAISASKPSR